jgi:hypothetical protein
MQKTLLVCLLFAACGGTTETLEETDAPAASAHARPQAPPADADGFGLQDTAGPIPGLPGFSFVRTLDANHCGGIAVSIERSPTATVASEDQSIVDFFDMQFPEGLDFTTSPDRSKETFDRWLDEANRRSGLVMTELQQRAKSGEPAEQLAAAARLVQAHRFFASMLLRAALPLDVRSGDHTADKRDAYCNAIATAAEPLLTKAKTLASKCAQLAKDQPGWWTSVCVP